MGEKMVLNVGGRRCEGGSIDELLLRDRRKATNGGRKEARQTRDIEVFSCDVSMGGFYLSFSSNDLLMLGCLLIELEKEAFLHLLFSIVGYRGIVIARHLRRLQDRKVVS